MRFLFLLTGVFILLASCSRVPSFSVKNELNTTRNDEVIILSRAFLENKIKFAEGTLPAFEKDGILIPGQVDDLDRDGKWDEAAILVNLAPNENSKIKIKIIESNNYPVFDKRTNLRLGIRQDDGSFKEVDKYKALPCSDGFEIIAQAESVNWENDKIAFRVYFDCRNVKDLFGKLKPELIVDKIQTPELPSYHELADWGMDVLHCGSSLGAGGLALLRNDSLYRLGSTEVYEYVKITEGPVRSVFELRYSGWNVAGEKLSEVERISVYPGKYWFESDVTLNDFKTGDQIVTGIVTSKLKREPFEMRSDSFQCIGTHDIQSLNDDELGMAVLIPAGEAGKVGRTSNINFFELGEKTVVEKNFSQSISETYYIGQLFKTGVPAKHYFFSVWGHEKEQWKTEDGFKKYIAEEAVKLSFPLEVK